MLVAQSKKKQNDYNANICEIEKKLTYYNHNKYITTPEFNKFTAEIFAARLPQANLITKTDFDTKLNLILINYALIEIELKKLQTFDSIFLETKVVSKKMAHKMIQYFSQCTDILKGLLMLVVVIIFIFGNLKDYLMKILHFILQLIIALLQN